MGSSQGCCVAETDGVGSVGPGAIAAAAEAGAFDVAPALEDSKPAAPLRIPGLSGDGFWTEGAAGGSEAEAPREPAPATADAAAAAAAEAASAAEEAAAAEEPAEADEESSDEGEALELAEERDLKPVNTLMAFLTGGQGQVTPKMERKRTRTSLLSDAGGSSAKPPPRVSRVSMRKRESLVRETMSTDALQTSDYIMSDILGEGQFGIVCACKRCATDEDFAVKLVDKVESSMVSIIEEARLLYGLSHPNVVKLHDFFDEQFFACIVMDRYSGSLIQSMSWNVSDKDAGGFNCFSIQHITRQMLAPLQYIHSKGIVHRDVTADNYLVDRVDILDAECNAVLCDFGLALTLKEGERVKTKVGRKLFMAPEVLAGGFSFAADVWSCGVTIFGLLDGRFPFANEADIKESHPTFRFGVHTACKDLVFRMLRKDESSRVDAASTLVHPWVTGEDLESIREDQLDKPKVVRTSASKPQARLQKKPTFKRGRSDDDVSHRRRVLLERILTGAGGLFTSQSREGAEALRKKRKAFSVVDPAKRVTTKYGWWPVRKVEESSLMEVGGAPPPSSEEAWLHIVKATLKQHNVDVKRFGQGSAKSLKDLATEVSVGECRLMLDATSHKKIVRVVRSVMLCVRTSGQDRKIGALLEPQTLVQTCSVDLKGLETNGMALPSVFQRPYENLEQAGQRILRDVLGLPPDSGLVAAGKPHAVETEERSPEFPGLPTVNCRTVLQFELSRCDDQTLAQLGLSGDKPDWTARGADGALRTFQWISDDDAEMLPDLQVENSAELAGVGSRLVPPQTGPTLEELKAFMKAAKIDISPATHKSLEDLYAEARKGDATLVLDSAGMITHVIDVLFFALSDVSSTCVLVEVEKAPSNGPKTKVPCLPSAKRRADENHFFTAWRILVDQLGFDCELVSIDRDDISYSETIQDSQRFPGLKTVMRKCLMKGTVNSAALSAA